MSAGTFDESKYELSADNGGGIAPCRVQPETLAAEIASTTNDAPAGAANLPVSAKANKTRREIGIGMRKVTLRFTSTLPTGYSGDDVTIPVMTPATFAAWTRGATGTYLSQPVVVVGRTSESVR